MTMQPPQDQQLPQSPPTTEAPQEPVHGGFSRFEIELEFVQCLANPSYLQHLANQNIIDQPEFVAYLKYLLYWTHLPYLRYLIFPGPTIHHLRLLQHESFRKALVTTGIVDALLMEETKAAYLWHYDEDSNDDEVKAEPTGDGTPLYQDQS